jgi:hypothetical protein
MRSLLAVTDGLCEDGRAPQVVTLGACRTEGSQDGDLIAVLHTFGDDRGPGLVREFDEGAR